MGQWVNRHFGKQEAPFLEEMAILLMTFFGLIESSMVVQNFNAAQLVLAPMLLHQRTKSWVTKIKKLQFIIA